MMKMLASLNDSIFVQKNRLAAAHTVSLVLNFLPGIIWSLL